MGLGGRLLAEHDEKTPQPRETLLGLSAVAVDQLLQHEPVHSGEHEPCEGGVVSRTVCGENATDSLDVLIVEPSDLGPELGPACPSIASSN